MQRSPSILVPVFALALAACQEAAPAKPAAAPAKPAAAASAAPAVAPGHLLRAEVDQVLVQQGPGWVFRRVILEEVLGRDGRFVGWRIVGLPEDWRTVDVRPGDVVTRVNGLPIEREYHAWDAWVSVAKLPELKISLMRDGATREVVVPIDGAPVPETLKLLNREASAAPRATAPAPAPAKSGSRTLGSSEGPEEEAY
jgi:hypothetical protein